MPVHSELNHDKPEGGRCPLIQNPLEECHCSSLDSLNTEAAIYYCGGNHHKCEIFQEYAQQKKKRFH
jgi:hypothetical protein